MLSPEVISLGRTEDATIKGALDKWYNQTSELTVIQQIILRDQTVVFKKQHMY